MRLWAAFYAITSLLTAQARREADPARSIVWATTASDRTLVGDWESPHAVVLVYGDAWLDTYFAMLDSLSAVVDVTVLGEEGLDPAEIEHSFEHLDDEQRTRVWSPEREVNSSWPRDYGPLQVRHPRGILWLDGLYTTDRPLDDELPARLAEWFGNRVEPLEYSIDGGAIASNGAGLCVTTREYLELVDIDASNEPLLQDLMRHIGCDGLALVPALEHEDTKHVDLMLQFLSPEHAVLARFDPEVAPGDARRTERAREIIAHAAAAMELPLRIDRVDNPPARHGKYASYVNFLLVEGHALVPTYESVDVALQRRAFAVLRDAMPDRVVVPIPADDVLPHGGSIHCLTWGLMRR